VVYVDPTSRTEADGYVWWQHDLGWSAAEKTDGTEYLMLPLDAQGNVIEPEAVTEPVSPPPPAVSPPPVPPPPTTLTFRVVTNVVNIRSAPRTGSDTLTGSQLKLGEIVQAEADSQTTMNGFIWWKHERGWSAARSVDNNQVFMEQFEEGTGGGARQITNILEVPWYSQVSATASRAFDCGQTCVLMLLRYYNKVGREMTVNDLTAIENGRTTYQELQGLAWRFGLALTLQPIKANKSSMESIRGFIDQGKPAIVLVNYLDLKLPNSLASPPHADPGLHWLVIRGYDQDRFLLNDPLWVEEEHRRKFSAGMIPVRLDTLMLAYRNALMI
jgi:uncharacterized protein YvpB